MDDGASPVIGLIVFLALMLVDAIMYGFSTAVDNVNDSQVEKQAQEGRKKALWLKKVIDEPHGTIHILQIMITFVSVIVGIYQGRIFGRILTARLLAQEDSIFFYGICYVAVALIAVFLLVSIGIVAPQKIAARKAEKWAFSLAGIVHVMVTAFTPFGFLVEKLSNLVVRIAGLDPNASMDDVTEEEIISMVNEGHEQGVLLASEAEMIHNIFEFGDKEAKDIMTHRKNIIAIDCKMTLAAALDFMLEKNNTRFPVYQEDIDNIVGVIHIKDAMIQSKNDGLSSQTVCQVPGLVRQINFIPETRNINTLFKNMQSQKNHMVIVVDEYGQTAGLVAMEDILEEIVGNILDEYDEEDTMIVEQADGSYLMKGMAPLDEVCEILNIDCNLEDYDTLNGYLISLIDKIPGDNEQFKIKDSGCLFHVLFVENKMIQTVRVTKIEEENFEESDTCKEEASVLE